MRRLWYCPSRGILLMVVAAAGCASAQRVADQPRPTPQAGDVVYVADGAGDFRMASSALGQAVAEDQRPLHVEPFLWSHGHWRIVSDQLDREHILAQGRRLAEEVAEHHRAYPDDAIFLVGHSAGCAVVLAAAEAVPSVSVDRIVLLAPAVPADYDLRPALRAARLGVDVHYSKEDTWELGAALRVMWALVGRWDDPAGLEGFRPHIENPEDASCYAKLVCFPWEPALLATTGHTGDHYGCYQQRYLRTLVLPRLCRQQTDPTAILPAPPVLPGPDASAAKAPAG